MKRTVTVRQELISGHDRLTDRQSQCDLDSDLTLTLVAQFYPKALGSLSVAFHSLHGCGGGILTSLHAGCPSLIIKVNERIMKG
jgi:hypothetical protein